MTPSSYSREPGCGLHIWSVRSAIMPAPERACCSGLIPARRDGVPSGAWSCTAGCWKSAFRTSLCTAPPMTAKPSNKIVSYARAAHMKNWLNLSTIGTFGGRGMGQTCGAADPSQWMRMFGVDIDSRDTSELIRTAERITQAEVAAVSPRLQKLFGKAPDATVVNERSIRLYLALKKVVEKEKIRFLHHPVISRPRR